MKSFLFIPLLVLLINLSGCFCSDDPIDMNQVNKRVTLNSEDLKNFQRLAEAMTEDLPKLRKQNESTTAPGDKSTWMSTNSYYLDLIDSIKYRNLLAPLKGKHVDDYWISKSGEIEFGLKEYTQMKCDTYNDSYQHVLIRTTAKDTMLNQSFGDVQKVYVDSVINSNWRYQYFMTHTGW